MKKQDIAERGEQGINKADTGIRRLREGKEENGEGGDQEEKKAMWYKTRYGEEIMGLLMGNGEV